METPAKIMESLNNDMLRLKAYFPYRIIWACYNPKTGEHYAAATKTKHQLNSNLRKGFNCYVLA